MLGTRTLTLCLLWTDFGHDVGRLSIQRASFLVTHMITPMRVSLPAVWRVGIRLSTLIALIDTLYVSAYMLGGSDCPVCVTVRSAPITHLIDMPHMF